MTLVFCGQPVEALMNFFEELGVSWQRLLGDRFDAEGFFDVGQHGIVIRVCRRARKRD